MESFCLYITDATRTFEYFILDIYLHFQFVFIQKYLSTIHKYLIFYNRNTSHFFLYMYLMCEVEVCVAQLQASAPPQPLEQKRTIRSINIHCTCDTAHTHIDQQKSEH